MTNRQNIVLPQPKIYAAAMLLVLTVSSINVFAAPPALATKPTANPATKPTTKPAVSTKAAPAVLPIVAERIVSVEGITEYRLPNGLKVVLFPDTSKPTAVVNVTYLVGSRHENYGETGMAHLLEHLLFKGTPTNADIPKQFNQRGAGFQGTTNFDRTNYYESFPASDENLKWAIELEADRMIHSNIARKDLDSEMSVVRNEYEIGENNPGQVLNKRMLSVAFDWHNYQNSPIGNRSDIENVKIENLQAFYRQYYQPDNAVLLVAGKFDEEATLKLITAAFGKIPKPTRVLPKLWTIEPTQDGERSFTVRRSGNIQISMLGYKVPGSLHPDNAALTYLGFILGNTPSGRLHKLLVETNRAAGVGAGGGSTVDPGIFNFIAAVKEGESLDDVQKTLIDTVENFYKSPPTEEEMGRLRVLLDKSFDQVMANPQGLAVAMSEVIAAGDWRLFFYSRDQIKKVTPEDVARVAKKYLTRDNRTVGQFLPTKDPQRAEVPMAPLAADVLKDYKGNQAMAAGETFDPTPANIDARTKRYALPGGMKVALLSKKNRGETVTVRLSSNYGDVVSQRGRTTAMSFASQMLSKGTTKFNRSQLSDEFDKLKISGNVGLGNAGMQTTRANLVKALELVAHVMREPTFPEAELEQMRKQSITGLEAGKSDPGALAGEAMNQHFNNYQRGDPRHSPTREENLSDLKAVTLAQVKKAHEDFLGFSNAEIAIVGDFDEAEARVAIERIFGNWKSPLPFKRIENPYHEVAAMNKVIETPDKENAVFGARMLLEVGDNDPESPALQVANRIFGGGGGLSSRLSKRIRGKEGLTYGVNTGLSLSSFDRRGSFSANASAAPQNIAKLESIFREELDLALKGGFTAEELDSAKSSILQSRKQAWAQDATLASGWVDKLYRGKTYEESAKYNADIAALTVEAVNAAFRKYIDPAKLSVVKAGDFAKAAKASTTVNDAKTTAPGATSK